MSVPDVDVDALKRRALRWLADDPDPATRAELSAVIEALPGSAPDLADRFAGPLTFGTAGLRGPMRAGQTAMNVAVVRAAAAGLAAWLDSHDALGPVVVGYDARRGSTAFARETALVITATGRRVLLLPRELPTPVLAHAVRALGACAGVMVTASHNPPQDNGYKVYLGAGLGGPSGDGAQIVAPVDAEISAMIRAVGPLAEVPLGGDGEVLGEEVIESYLDGVLAVLDAHVVAPALRADLRVAYTALHGVGEATVTEAFRRGGFAAPASVSAQSRPDPTFPTVTFPNPEEPGAMDLVLARAAEVGADIAIANDPDADRCAVAVPLRAPADGWRVLRGDEVGILLADHLIRRGTPGVYATTIVSSSMLGAICRARAITYAETLTGFKWIVRAADPDADSLVYGYEEALGYCVAPQHVRDKDGISAALLVAELAAGLKAEGRTLLDRLDELAARFGVYATDQLSVRVSRLPEIDEVMAKLRASAPTRLIDEPVIAVDDLAPAADVVTLRTKTARVVIRPSGTEPKLKAYLEIVAPVSAGEEYGAYDVEAVAAARERAATALGALRTEVATVLRV